MDGTKLEERKEMICGFVSSEGYTPMKPKEMAQMLSVPRAEKEEFADVINALVMDGKIIIDQKGRIKKADAGSIAGIFSGTQRGFGFVTIDGESEDVFISPDNVNGARDRDRVLVSLINGSSRGRSREGIVISILAYCGHKQATIEKVVQSSQTGF